MKSKNNLKGIVLAGGYGTRLSEYTKIIPKPMVNLAGHPIIIHLMLVLLIMKPKQYIMLI